MYLRLFHFGRRELARFIEDMVRDGQLADVVQQRAGAEGVDVALVQSEQISQPDRINLGSADVAHSDLIAGIDGSRERLDSSEMHSARFADLFRFQLKGTLV